MGIARRWVFPIIRIIVFAAIAAALIKLAFFGGFDTTEDTSLQPTGELTQPEVQVALGTIRNDVELDGTVNADAAVAVKATLAGEVKKVLAAAGSAVEPTTPLLTIYSETPNADGTALVKKTVTVTAGATGILSSVSVIAGQLVEVGEVVGQVAPPTFNVTGTLAPEQQYRLLNKPTEALVTITGGPAPFTCTGLSITTPLAGAGDTGSQQDPSADPGASSGGTTVRCAVPAGVTVFAGLAAKLTVAGGIAENVLVVPTTAVEGSSGTGVVYQAAADGGEPTKLDVTLGINDGQQVEITGGLAEGDSILMFVPGADAVDPESGEFIGGYGG